MLNKKLNYRCIICTLFCIVMIFIIVSIDVLTNEFKSSSSEVTLKTHSLSVNFISWLTAGWFFIWKFFLQLEKVKIVEKLAWYFQLYSSQVWLNIESCQPLMENFGSWTNWISHVFEHMNRLCKSLSMFITITAVHDNYFMRRFNDLYILHMVQKNISLSDCATKASILY